MKSLSAFLMGYFRSKKKLRNSERYMSASMDNTYVEDASTQRPGDFCGVKRSASYPNLALQDGSNSSTKSIVKFLTDTPRASEYHGTCQSENREGSEPTNEANIPKVDVANEGRVIDTADHSSKNSVKLRDLIMEFKETEEHYVSALRFLIERLADADDPSDIHDASVKKRYIFGNVRQIYEFHFKHVLPELTAANLDLAKIAAIFTEKRFLFYIKYYENQSRAREILKELHPYFDGLRRQLQSREDITSLLILPTQRLPRYRLLLQTMQKYCESHSSGSLQVAINSIDRVINQAQMFIYLNRLEHFNEPGGVVALGQLLKHGYLLVSYGSQGCDAKSVSAGLSSETDQKSVNKRLYRRKQKSALHAKGSKIGEDHQFTRSIDDHLLPGSTYPMAVFLFTQAILFSDWKEESNKFEEPRFFYRFHLKMNKISVSDFLDFNSKHSLGPREFSDRSPSLAGSDDVSIMKGGPQHREFLITEINPGHVCRRIICTCRDNADYDGWYNVIIEQLQNQNDFISALTNPTAMTGASPERMATHIHTMTAGASEFERTRASSIQKESSFVLPNEATAVKSHKPEADDEISIEIGDKLQIIAANSQMRLFVNRPANVNTPAAEGWIPGCVVGFAKGTSRDDSSVSNA